MDDLANLCVFLMNNYSGNETVNAGTGKELTIKELTELVAKVVAITVRSNGILISQMVHRVSFWMFPRQRTLAGRIKLSLRMAYALRMRTS